VVEKPFNEDALAEMLATRRAEIDRSRLMQTAVLLILLTGAAGMLVLARLQSLQRKVYRPTVDVDESRFDINNASIHWLKRSPEIDARLRTLGYGFAGLSGVLLSGAVFAEFSAPALLAICLVLLGLGGCYLAVQRAFEGYIGLLGDQLILVDHRKTYRVGRGPNVQYRDEFVMIDDVIVFLGSRRLPRFAENQLQQEFLPLFKRGIKIDRATLQLKLMNSRHPLLLGAAGLALCVALALLLFLS
jgi:hypothetical protein